MASLVLTTDVLGDVFAKHGDALVSFFARRTFDAETAFDLAAETFAEAVACRHRFAGDREEQVVAWLYGIAGNQLGSYIRRGAIKRRAMQRLGLERPPLADADVERIVNDAGLAELREAVEASLAQLPEHHRDAVCLRVIQDHSYAETAAKLNITEQTARAHVSRGLRRLRQIVPASTLTTMKEGAS